MGLAASLMPAGAGHGVTPKGGTLVAAYFMARRYHKTVPYALKRPYPFSWPIHPKKEVSMIDLQERPRLLLTMPEAARELGISRSAVYVLAAEGRLPVVKVGCRMRVVRSVLEDRLRQEVETGSGDLRGPR